MKWEQVLSNLEKKENFDFAVSSVLEKVTSGIRGYSIEEMQNLGRMVSLINRYNNFTSNDNRVVFLNDQLISGFKLVLQNTNSADKLKGVLAFYPIVVLDGIIEAFPQSIALRKIRNILSLAENIRKESAVRVSQIEKVSSDKTVTVKVDRNKLEQSMKIAEDLNEKVKQVGVNSVERILDKLIVKKKEMENNIEEITERLGPFIYSDYSKEDIQKWLEALSDEGLISMDGENLEEITDDVQEYFKLNPVEVDFDESAQSQTDVVAEANSFKFDLEQEENRIQRVVQTDVKKIKEEYSKDSESFSRNEQVQEDDLIVTEGIIEDLKEEADEAVQEVEEKEIIQPIGSEHYNQGDMVSKLIETHKKGTSI